jgi:tRNA threonylcarbamoyladenosine biosynthesis protein TsaE
MESHEFTTHSPEETKRVAADLVEQLLPSMDEGKGVLILLEGDYGVGKTQFVKGIGAKLGIDESKVLSPSYTYMNEYKLETAKGYKFRLIHVDAWRIKTTEDFELTGLKDMLRPGNVVAVEWGGNVMQNIDLRFKNLVTIQVKFKEVNATDRVIEITYE